MFDFLLCIFDVYPPVQASQKKERKDNEGAFKGKKTSWLSWMRAKVVAGLIFEISLTWIDTYFTPVFF